MSINLTSRELKMLIKDALNDINEGIQPAFGLPASEQEELQKRLSRVQSLFDILKQTK